MATTINMQGMRYINLLAKISGVKTTKCFNYNNHIVFAVPKMMVSKAIGKGAENVKQLRNILGKRIKIISMPAQDDEEGIKKFVEDIIDPIECNNITLQGNTITINAGKQSKAALIGRNRQREKELTEILKNNFSIPTIKIV